MFYYFCRNQNSQL